MAALLTFYYFLSSSSLSFHLFHCSSLVSAERHTFPLVPSNTNVSRLNVTGERQWSRFDLDGNKRPEWAIVGPGASINEWHETVVRFSGGRWSSGGGMMEGGWQRPTHSPHLCWAQPSPRAHTHRLSQAATDEHGKWVVRKTCNHLQPLNIRWHSVEREFPALLYKLQPISLVLFLKETFICTHISLKHQSCIYNNHKDC